MKKILITLCLALLLFPSISFGASNLSYGAECKSDSECNSGNCKVAKNGSIVGKSFCSCSDNTFSSSDDEYCRTEFQSKYPDAKEAAWECVEGTAESGGIDYCQNGPIAEYPAGPQTNGDTGLVDTISKSLEGASLTENELDAMLKKPEPRIKIPGLQFSDVSVEKNKVDDPDGNTYLFFPFIGEYIAAVYRYLIVIISIIAVIILIISGFQWAIPDASGENISAAKTRIIGAISGLIIAVSSYVILYTVNPELVQFRSLRVLYVKGIPLDIEGDDNDNTTPTNSAKAKPAKTTFTNTIPGETKIGRCHVIDESLFPTFSIDDFSDGGIGQCLLEEYFPNVGSTGLTGIKSEMISTTFLGKPIRVHKKAAAALQGVENEIKQKNSPVVKFWVDNFHTDGGWVDSTSMKSIAAKCNQDGPESWVVTKKDSNGQYASRLGNRILQNLYGNHTNVIRGDLHAFGVAIDVYAKYNPDYKNGDGKITRPMVTQVPVEVAEAFYNHGYQWLGSAAGRDAMHFQYYGGSCFGGQGNKFPSGNGCCLNTWVSGAKPTFDQCIAKGGTAKSYQDCLGPNGKPESMWIKESVEPK